MAIKMGFACKLGRNGGTWASPTWNDCKLAKDVTLSIEDEEADATCRGAAGWEQLEPAIRKSGLELEMPWDPADTNLTALQTAYLARTALDLVCLDGAFSGAGSQGLRAMFKIFKFARAEPLAGVAQVALTIKPCYEMTNLPNWVTFA